MQLSSNLILSRYEWANECLQELLINTPLRNVADIGAGEGVMRACVEAAGGQWQGFDLSPKLPTICQWDLDCPAPENCRTASIVLMLDVLEHLNNPWRGLGNLVSVLEPGGYLVLTMPNPLWSRSRTHLLARGSLTCFTQSDLDLNHHVFTPWPHIVERLLNDMNLQVERYVTLDGATQLPGAPYNLRYPSRYAYSLLNIMIERWDPRARGMSYGILAKNRRST